LFFGRCGPPDGAMHTLDTMSHFLMSMEMIIVGRAIGVGGTRVTWKKTKKA